MRERIPRLSEPLPHGRGSVLALTCKCRRKRSSRGRTWRSKSPSRGAEPAFERLCEPRAPAISSLAGWWGGTAARGRLRAGHAARPGASRRGIIAYLTGLPGTQPVAPSGQPSPFRSPGRGPATRQHRDCRNIPDPRRHHRRRTGDLPLILQRVSCRAFFGSRASRGRRPHGLPQQPRSDSGPVIQGATRGARD